ncbi:MAG: hypothetical protein WCG94_09125, partial [Methanothrix sp.]
SWLQFLLYLAALCGYGYFHLNFIWLFRTILKALGASILMVIASWLTLNTVDWIYQTTGWGSTHLVWGLLLQLVLAALAGILVYLGYAKKTHPEEWQWVKASVLSRRK